MKKTNVPIDPSKCLTVDRNNLALLLNVGSELAAKIGTEAGARIQIGRRVVYSVEKVKRYMLTEYGVEVE